MVKEQTTPKKTINGWTIADTTLANFGTDYNNRAKVSIWGLGANLAADAIYQSCALDVDGNPLNGKNNYVLHFNKGELPPVKAFWSLTMYGPDGYMVANPINRNTIGDRSNLKTNADGSTDIYLQYSSPGKDKESNWLPAPEGDFNILLRAYWPEENMIQGKWLPPAVKKQ